MRTKGIIKPYSNAHFLRHSHSGTLFSLLTLQLIHLLYKRDEMEKRGDKGSIHSEAACGLQWTQFQYSSKFQKLCQQSGSFSLSFLLLSHSFPISLFPLMFPNTRYTIHSPKHFQTL